MPLIVLKYLRCITGSFQTVNSERISCSLPNTIVQSKQRTNERQIRGTFLSRRVRESLSRLQRTILQATSKRRSCCNLLSCLKLKLIKKLTIREMRKSLSKLMATTTVCSPQGKWTYHKRMPNKTTLGRNRNQKTR